MTVSEHERARQVDAMFSGGLVQHAGARFSARASGGGGVGAIIYAVEMSSGVAQLNGHQIVDGVHERFRIIFTTDSGLIGDHENEKASLIKFADGSRRKWEHTKSRNVIQVSDFFGNG